MIAVPCGTPMCAPKRRKAQKPRGFRANNTHSVCIKDWNLLDPTSGSGSLLINIGKAAAKRVGSSDGIMCIVLQLIQQS